MEETQERDAPNWGVWIRQWRTGGKGEDKKGSFGWGVQALLFYTKHRFRCNKCHIIIKRLQNKTLKTAVATDICCLTVTPYCLFQCHSLLLLYCGKTMMILFYDGNL